MTDERVETLDERKARKLAETYPIKIPPREVEVEFETEGGEKKVYVLRRPTIGARNRLLKDIGALKVGAVEEVDARNWVKVIKATLVKPELKETEIEELDAYEADVLFTQGQNMLVGSVLSRAEKN